MPRTYVVVPDRRARARRHPAVRRLLLEGRDPRRGARRAATFGYVLFVAGAGRRVPDRPLHVPAALHRLRRRAVARSRASTSTSRTDGEGPCSMSGRSRVLAVLVDRRRLDPVRAALDPIPTGSSRSRRAARRADGRRRRSSSSVARRRARPRRDRRRLGSLRPQPRGRCRAAAGAASLEQKFYFDELYDARLLQAGRLRSRARSTRCVERPLIARLDRPSVAGGTPARLGRGSRRVQTGLVRAYALALAGGLAVLVVVFIAVR